MKGIKKIVVIIICISGILSCGDKEKNTTKLQLQKDRYFNLENIGWKSKSYTQQVEDILYTATEVPIQYYLLKDQGTGDLSKIDSLYEINKTERIFEFTFAQEKEKNLMQEEYTAMDYTKSLKYLSFKLSNDFYVVTSSNDTITCNGATIDRNYQIAPYKRVLLYFSGINPEEEVQLIYNDKLFQNGLMKFKAQHNHTPIIL